MAVITKTIHVSTKGDTDIIDITTDVNRELGKTKLNEGIVCISIPGSTAGITTCEYEPGLIKDLKEVFQKLAPQGKPYHHDDTWHDGNGHAHVRASLLGGSATFPFSKSQLILGTWQQIILIDFDNHPRQRKIILQFVGE